jgi:hypothetical protein
MIVKAGWQAGVVEIQLLALTTGARTSKVEKRHLHLHTYEVHDLLTLREGWCSDATSTRIDTSFHAHQREPLP